MRAKVSVLGHFGEGKNLLNGQTVKTKIITKELQNQFGKDRVLTFDTHGGKKALFKAPLQAFSALKSAKNVIMLPAHNGLRVFGRLLPWIKRFFKNRRIHYVVIGGWLSEFLKDKKGLAKALKKFDGIYVETSSMKAALEALGFENIAILPNFKSLTPLKEEELAYPTNEPYKLCTFSRVMKEKGIEDAVRAVTSINENCGRTVYTLDIYGQVDASQTEWFDSLQATFPEYVKYGGLVPFDKSVEVLKDYFALLFPTYYEGEGFAGTLIDSFAAGLPIIATDWKYNAEIIETGKNGIIYSLKDQDTLEKILYSAANFPKEIISMKAICLKKARLFSPEVAIKPLIDNLTQQH